MEDEVAVLVVLVGFLLSIDGFCLGKLRLLRIFGFIIRLRTYSAL